MLRLQWSYIRSEMVLQWSENFIRLGKANPFGSSTIEQAIFISSGLSSQQIHQTGQQLQSPVQQAQAIIKQKQEVLNQSKTEQQATSCQQSHQIIQLNSLHRFKKAGSKNYQNIYPPSATLHLSNIP